MIEVYIFRCADFSRCRYNALSLMIFAKIIEYGNNEKTEKQTEKYAASY
jgi:hypothetical protein